MQYFAIVIIVINLSPMYTINYRAWRTKILTHTQKKINNNNNTKESNAKTLFVTSDCTGKAKQKPLCEIVTM